MLGLVGCGGHPAVLPTLAPAIAPIELVDTAFFPQTAYHCGPAALATLLHSAGRDADPDRLADQVYLPGRRGSLQVELLAATRRAGLIPYVIDPTLEALLAEPVAGRPVLVLQNLGLAALPVWHYAVVIGVDPVADRVILRSGEERRQLSPTYAFLRSWRLADNWAMVALRPGELPVYVDARRYLEAVARAGSRLSPQARAAAYRAALERWPSDIAARFGLGHALEAGGEPDRAAAEYRRLLRSRPRHAPALNNLAGILAARGCHAAARDAATRALEIARADHPGLVGPIGATLAGLDPDAPDAPACRRTNPLP